MKTVQEYVLVILVALLLASLASAQLDWPKAQFVSKVLVEGQGSTAKGAAAANLRLRILPNDSNGKTQVLEVLYVLEDQGSPFRALKPLIESMKENEVRQFKGTRFSLTGFPQVTSYYEDPYLIEITLLDLYQKKEVVIKTTKESASLRQARLWDTVRFRYEVYRSDSDKESREIGNFECVLAPEKTSLGLVKGLSGMRVGEQRDLVVPYYLGERIPGWRKSRNSLPLRLKIELQGFVDSR